MNFDNFETFSRVYRVELARAVADNPSEYGWPAEDAPRVADKMLDAIRRGSYNKDSRAIKAACRVLSIPYTYKGIAEYLR